MVRYLAIFLIILFSTGCGKQAPSKSDYVDDLARPLENIKIERVVSLAPNVTQILYFLGVWKKVKAVTRYCNYPPQSKTLPSVGGIINPDLEKILRIKPQLVLLSHEANSRSLAASLKNGGLQYYVVKIRSIKDIFSSLYRLARYLRVSKRVTPKIDRLKKSVHSLHGKLTGKRVFAYFSSGNAYYAFGKDSLLAELVRYCGAENLGDKGQGAFPKMNKEMLSRLRPDFIFLLAKAKQKKIIQKAKQMWKLFSPQAKLVAVDPDVFSRPGPRLLRTFIQLVAQF